jgi:hypothetical protein
MCAEEEEEAEEDTPGSRKSQKTQIKRLNSSSLLRFARARIRPKFKKKIPDFYTWFYTFKKKYFPIYLVAKFG